MRVSVSPETKMDRSAMNRADDFAVFTRFLFASKKKKKFVFLFVEPAKYGKTETVVVSFLKWIFGKGKKSEEKTEKKLTDNRKPCAQLLLLLLRFILFINFVVAFSLSSSTEWQTLTGPKQLRRPTNNTILLFHICIIFGWLCFVCQKKKK